MCNCVCRSTCFREGKSRGGAGNVTSVSFIYVWKHNKACQRNVRTCCAIYFSKQLFLNFSIKFWNFAYNSFVTEANTALKAYNSVKNSFMTL